MDDAFTEKATLAVETLGFDMITNVEFSLDSSLLLNALDQSFTVYEEIIPLYSESRDRYLDEIASITERIIPKCTYILEENIYSLSKYPIVYVQHDKSLAGDLKSLSSEKMEATLIEMLSTDPDIVNAFEGIRTEFMSMRDVYLNLGKVGVEIVYPEPAPINLVSLASIVTEVYFEELEVVEETLKNQGYNPDSLYYIFWEGNNV